MENPGLLSETSTVAKAVTIAALHSKNQHKIWMVQVSFREEEKQCPLKDLRVGVERRKKEKKMGGGGAGGRKRKKEEARLFFSRVGDPQAQIVLSA